jgi:hypothetical protein
MLYFDKNLISEEHGIIGLGYDKTVVLYTEEESSSEALNVFS